MPTSCSRSSGPHRAEKVASWPFAGKGRRGADSRLDAGVVTDIVRPARESFREELIDYATPHSLIDYERTTVINADEFPDLELTSKRVPVVLEEMVTINRFGDLKHIDSDHQTQGYDTWKSLMERQKTVWRRLRMTAEPTGGTGRLLGPGEDVKRSVESPGRPRGSGKRSLGGEGLDPYGGGD